MNTLYPPKPLNAGNVSIAPSENFKKEVAGVVFTIILFCIVYIALVIGAGYLAIGCFYLGGALIIAMPKIFTILIGIGLMALGVSLVFFLIKFVFAKRNADNPDRVEITEAEQPRLFAFIRQLTIETQTPFPRKIFLSPQVNACVFYNSSFWSMFFPVKKNLEIGLGLVNAINLGEFKAVMAHEFGHFSQRSMKLGSFTYNVNQVIYNMLYENNSYSSFLSTWGNIHGALALFASITVYIATGIQWILRQMYALVNKRYLSLSREMEFHADAVAASVAGGNNLVSALDRIELAAGCYEEAVNKVNEALPRKQASRNLFVDQLIVMHHTAKTQGLQISHQLPVITSQFIASQHTSRINYKNQWASHPTNKERADKLQELGLDTPLTPARAWELFDAPQALQEKITNHIYTTAKIEMADIVLYDGVAFEQQYEAAFREWQLPEAYKNFFQGRYPDLILIPSVQPHEAILWESIDTPANRELPDQLKSTEADLQLLEAIADPQTGIKSFDFDGQKYTNQEAAGLATQLRTEAEDLRTRLHALDKRLLTWLMQENAAGMPAFQQWDTLNKRFEEAGTKVMNILHVFYNQTGLTLEEVEGHISTLRNSHEPALKAVWKELIDKNLLTNNASLHEEISTFLGKQYAYWMDNQFLNEELNTLYKLISDSATWMLQQKFTAFKQWLIPTLPSSAQQAIA